MSIFVSINAKMKPTPATHRLRRMIRTRVHTNTTCVCTQTNKTCVCTHQCDTRSYPHKYDTHLHTHKYDILSHTQIRRARTRKHNVRALTNKTSAHIQIRIMHAHIDSTHTRTQTHMHVYIYMMIIQAARNTLFRFGNLVGNSPIIWRKSRP